MVAYHQPTTLKDALTLLSAKPPLTVLAGGTDIYPAKATRAGWGNLDHHDVLDISRIAELRAIEDRGDHWWIGALTTWSDIARADLPPLFDGLKAAAGAIGGVQIQNRGTIAGNICTASPAGDSIPCLLALDAEVECVGGVEFRVPIDKFITGYRQTALVAEELVTGIRVTKQSGRGSFLKLGARRYLVISIAMVAARIAQDATGRITDAAIAVGACSAVAQRLPVLEQRLIGKPPDANLVLDTDIAHLAPIDDVRATGAYRRAVALQLVRDCLHSYRVNATTEAA